MKHVQEHSVNACGHTALTVKQWEVGSGQPWASSVYRAVYQLVTLTHRSPPVSYIHLAPPGPSMSVILVSTQASPLCRDHSCKMPRCASTPRLLHCGVGRLLLLICEVCALLSAPLALASIAPPTVTLSVDVTAAHPSPIVSLPIPPNFQGVSIEWWGPRNYTGPSPSALHSSFLNILPYLAAHHHRGPTIRVGGATSDESYYDPGGVAQPDWYNFAQTTTLDDYAAMYAVAQRLNATLIFGINFRLAANVTYTMLEVDAIASVTGWQGVVLELGNEPELYECHTQKYRPCGWTFDDYMSEWDAVTSAILAKHPDAPSHLFQAGAMSGGWTPQLPSFVGPRQDRIHSASFHRYAYGTCDSPLTVDIVLSDDVALPALLQPIAQGVTYASVANDVRSETNGSVLPSFGECGMMWCLDGDPAGMDAFAAALWIVDYNLAVASLNVSSAVYYMGWQPPPVFRAAPFVVPDADVDAIEVLPIMYGMWLFALASRNDARIVNATRIDSTDGLSLLKTWALRDADDDVVVVAVHKLYNATDNATLAVSVASDGSLTAPVAHVLRMTAPSVYSSSSITLAGLTWDNTTNGRIRLANGSVPAVERVQGQSQGDGVWQYTVQVRPGEAVLIAIPTQQYAASGTESWDERERALSRAVQFTAAEQQMQRRKRRRESAM